MSNKSTHWHFSNIVLGFPLWGFPSSQMLAKFRSFDDNSCYFTVVSSYVGIVRIWTIIFVRVVQVHSTFYDFDVFDTMFSFVWYELSVLRGWGRCRGWMSNIALPHRLASSYLRHCRSTVQVCDQAELKNVTHWTAVDVYSTVRSKMMESVKSGTVRRVEAVMRVRKPCSCMR